MSVDTSQASIEVVERLVSFTIDGGSTTFTIDSQPVEIEIVDEATTISISESESVTAETVDVSVDITEGTTTVVEVGVMGPQGIQGPQGDPGAVGGSFVHQQNVPSATWTINHGLGYFPNVTVVDSGMNEVEGSITYIDVNSLTISFTSGFGGWAYCS